MPGLPITMKVSTSEHRSVPPPGFAAPVPASGDVPAPHWQQTPPPSPRALAVAMVLSGALAWGLLAIVYYSFVLFVSLINLGVPITIVLGTAASLKIEQASVYWVTGLRPQLLQLAQAAAPGLAVSAAAHQVITGSMLARWTAASAIGLALNGMVLHRLLTKTAGRERT